MPTATDGVVPFDRVGTVELEGVGRLDVWWLGSYGGGIFVPLRDGTAGTTTYGGGRYLLDTVKGADLGGSGRAPGRGPQLRLPPVVHLRPALVLPAGARGEPGDRVRWTAGEQLPDGGWY